VPHAEHALQAAWAAVEADAQAPPGAVAAPAHSVHAPGAGAITVSHAVKPEPPSPEPEVAMMSWKPHKSAHAPAHATIARAMARLAHFFTMRPQASAWHEALATRGRAATGSNGEPLWRSHAEDGAEPEVAAPLGVVDPQPQPGIAHPPSPTETSIGGRRLPPASSPCSACVTREDRADPAECRALPLLSKVRARP
jgi:hypothetical protein